MRINQVEELVGITKKNIRFYEEQGLLTVQRNSDNGYREYSDDDVQMLRKIKLLRQLSIPIEEIQKLQKGYLTLDDCMKRHSIFLDREMTNINHKKTICSQLECENQQFASMETEKYLDMMKEMEKEGARFMNIEHIDKKKTGPIIATICTIIFMIAIICLLIWANSVEPIPLPLLMFFIMFPGFVIIGVLLALKDRMKQIKGGEEDAASKY